MNVKTLDGFEGLAEQVLSETDGQRRLTGLNGLCQKMQNSEPALFDIAESCDVELRYVDFINLPDYRNKIRCFIGAKDYFDIYDNETDEQVTEREKEWIRTQRKCDISSKWRQTDEEGGNTWIVGNYKQGNRVTFEEKWVYMQDGYYSVWHKYRGCPVYRLCMGLMDASHGDITQQEREVLRLYPKEWEDIGLPKEFERRKDERRRAERSIDAATERLNIEIRAICLWCALRTEKAKLNGYLDLYQKPFKIDKRLASDKARGMFQRFKDDGYIEIREGKHYKWNEPHTKLELAYFVSCAIDYLDLNSEKNKNGTWAAFEELFDVTRLQSYLISKDTESDDRCARIAVLFQQI